MQFPIKYFLPHIVFFGVYLAALIPVLYYYRRRTPNPRFRPTFGEMAMFITPHDPEILQNLARAYQETGDGNKAIYSYDTMLALVPPPRRPALVHIGRTKAFIAMKKLAEAKAALAQALKTEPENAEALELKARLK